MPRKTRKWATVKIGSTPKTRTRVASNRWKTPFNLNDPREHLGLDEYEMEQGVDPRWKSRLLAFKKAERERRL